MKTQHNPNFAFYFEDENDTFKVFPEDETFSYTRPRPQKNMDWLKKGISKLKNASFIEEAKIMWEQNRKDKNRSATNSAIFPEVEIIF